MPDGDLDTAAPESTDTEKDWAVDNRRGLLEVLVRSRRRGRWFGRGGTFLLGGSLNLWLEIQRL